MMILNKILIVLVISTVLLKFGNAQTTEIQDSIYSKNFEEYRSFSIYTPEDYVKSKDSCVIMFMLDGGLHANYVSASLNYLSQYARTIPDIIVVGIHQKKRFEELGYAPDIIMQQDCHAEDFSDFIIKELYPYIEGQYRVYPFKILAGHSLGANFTLYNLMYNNDFYNAFLAISPDFTRDTMLLHKLYNFDYVQVPKNSTLFVTHEEYLFSEKEKAQLKFKSLIDTISLSFNANYKYNETVNHMSITPLGFIEGVNYIFKDYFLPKETVDNNGLDGIIDHYRQVEKKYGFKLMPDYDLLLNLAYSISFMDGRHREALDIIDYCTQNYNENYMTYWVKAEVYYNMNEPEIAFENFNKAIKLNPDDPDLQERYNTLQSRR
ncbi:MAG: hypothetical protein C0596_08635 [Marinilabiliales bacterium]|nr:MAG: hypothetical protein C0596_08635 [Marinilabiliales bacterium]